MNEHGWSDRAYPLEKPADTYRIVVLGDSYVEAKEVPLEKTFHKLLEKDLRPAYQFLKSQLQVMSHGHPSKRWILKSPFHLWHLDALLDVFPDARIVFTHRSITESLPSNCSLSAMTTSKFSNHTDLKVLGQFWRRYYRIGMDRAIEQRQRIVRFVHFQ